MRGMSNFERKLGFKELHKLRKIYVTCRDIQAFVVFGLHGITKKNAGKRVRIEFVLGGRAKDSISKRTHKDGFSQALVCITIHMAIVY